VVPDVLTIDGSFGEGGGQILRTSLALSAVTGQAFRIRGIRAGRAKPGLAAQHLTCVRAVAEICAADVGGDELGSQDLEFFPNGIRGGKYLFDIAAESASAGATGLVFQSVLPALLFADEPSEITLRGGTHVQWAPHFHYLDLVFRPTVRLLGAWFELELTRAGWYPRGEGQLVARISPAPQLTALNWAERPRKVALTSRALLSDLPAHIAERENASAQARLRGYGYESRLVAEELASVGKGTLCFLHTAGDSWAGGATSFGEIKKRAEVVGDQAGKDMLRYLRTRAAVDPHLADQLALYCALARGSSSYTTSEVTLHLTTVLTVIRTFLAVNCELNGGLGETGTVRLDGIGHRPE
jgi:RNA 3'-terminal phosphate cyclase (ATP)